MSQLNINDLPSEMLTKIFRRLDAVDLKNASLACKLWNNLIESGCRWSVNVHYDHYYDYCHRSDVHYGRGGRSYRRPIDVQKTNFILTTKRRFGKIIISHGRLRKDNQTLEIFRRQGFNVVKLCLRFCDIDNRAVFAQLLKLTPNLESLDISSMNIYNFTDVPLDPVLPELKKLKILNMPETQAQPPIIECFRNAKLTKIHIRQDVEQDTETEPLVDFLSSQPTLTSLTIDHCNSSPRSILAQMGKLDVRIPFRLTKLGILGLGDLNSSQDHDNLVRFIEPQAESLTEVDLEWNIPISVYETVFHCLTKLRTLKLSLDDLPQDNPVFYDRLKENRSVCTMALRSSKLDVPWLGEILKRLPNIRCLILPGYGLIKESSLAVMAQHLGRLESLSLRVIRFSIGYVKFANLRTLHIGDLCNNINWNEFTKANPRFVELIIEKIYHKSLTSDDIDQITTNVDLQYLRLGDGFVADDRFFEIIRANCTNLKVLELHRSCVPLGLRHNVEINVLRLCDKINSSTWLI